ncbi:MAG: hypothetical protein K0R63_693 [Rickettsiales bacterium]|jgi:P pilus assembly chaperone PapD|nr:hypothetical protein [Rickettsiales bacterium]
MRFLFSTLLLILLGNAAYAESEGTLMVAPTRLVFEGRTRTQEVTLVNRGDKEATYRLSLKHMRMHENGSFEEITAPANGEQFADTLLRFAPRQITLKAGESQIVRVMVTKPADLKAGEYRSHLYFQTVPPENTGNDAESLATGEEKLSVKLTPIFGVSIPVIVEQGELSATTTIDSLKASAKTLDATLTRTGNRSVYGDFKVFDGEKVIGEVRGVSLLYPYTKRTIRIPLTTASQHPLRLIYHAHTNPNQIWAERAEKR